MPTIKTLIKIDKGKALNESTLFFFLRKALGNRFELRKEQIKSDCHSKYFPFSKFIYKR